MPRKDSRPRFAYVEPGTVSLYVRLSREASDTNLSRDGMLEDLRDLARREGLRVVSEHLDDGISGARRDRPAFRAWLAEAVEGRVASLAAWHVDRITREGTNAAALILDVVEGKDPDTGTVVRPPVRLLDVSGLDSEADPEGFRWRFVIGAEVARAERARMVARATARAARARARGAYIGGAPPFGFRRERNEDGDSIVVLEPDEATPLREAGLRIIAGEPLGRVSRWLSDVAPPRKRKSGRGAAGWSRVTLRQSLTTESAKRLLWTSGEWHSLTKALAVKSTRIFLTPRVGSRTLSGLIACHACGSRLQVAVRANEPAIYRCQTRADGGNCERPVAVSAPRIEEWAEREYLDRYGDLIVGLPVLVEVPAEGLEDAEEALRLAAGLMTEPGADLASLSAEVARLAQERDRLAALPPTTVEVIPGDGRTRREAWADADPPARRALLASALGGPILLGPGRRGRTGFDPARLLVDPWDAGESV